MKKSRKLAYTKEQCDLMVEAAILDVKKQMLMDKVDINKYCDNCKYTPCACHLIPTI